MNDRNAKIEMFLEKWNEMLDAANSIEEFEWKFSVGITSNNELVQDRIKTINGINDSFTKHEMTWDSSNS